MKKDAIDQLFEKLEGDFDIERPRLDHRDRFLSKLNSTDSNLVIETSKSFKLWRPFLAVAATLLLSFSLLTIFIQPNNTNDLANISPELSKTQDFFTSTIDNELNKLNKERTPQTKILIDDALKQLKILENDYESLQKDLIKSGEDKRVIYAMISNYQNRINVLQNVMERIDDVKQLKQTTL